MSFAGEGATNPMSTSAKSNILCHIPCHEEYSLSIFCQICFAIRFRCHSQCFSLCLPHSQSFEPTCLIIYLLCSHVDPGNCSNDRDSWKWADDSFWGLISAFRLETRVHLKVSGIDDFSGKRRHSAWEVWKLYKSAWVKIRVCKTPEIRNSPKPDFQLVGSSCYCFHEMPSKVTYFTQRFPYDFTRMIRIAERCRHCNQGISISDTVRSACRIVGYTGVWCGIGGYRRDNWANV